MKSNTYCNIVPALYIALLGAIYYFPLSSTLISPMITTAILVLGLILVGRVERASREKTIGRVVLCLFGVIVALTTKTLVQISTMLMLVCEGSICLLMAKYYLKVVDTIGRLKIMK